MTKRVFAAVGGRDISQIRATGNLTEAHFERNSFTRSAADIDAREVDIDDCSALRCSALHCGSTLDQTMAQVGNACQIVGCEGWCRRAACRHLAAFVL